MHLPWTIQRHLHAFSITAQGQMHPVLTQWHLPERRPYLHPLRSADGRSELTQDMPAHHPWQHGVAIGLNGVNGVGFWTEGLLPGHEASDGRMRSRLGEGPTEAMDGVRWMVEVSYLDPLGVTTLLHEQQRWHWRVTGEGYQLDLAWSLEACMAVDFAPYPYGGLFVRMPVGPGTAPQLLTGGGARTCAQAEGRPERFVAVSLQDPSSGSYAGLAVIDHPSNPGYPQGFRVDGEYGFGPARCIAGGWSLASQERCLQRYRIVAFSGVPDAQQLEQSTTAFARS
jgi:hypothetical protein